MAQAYKILTKLPAIALQTPGWSLEDCWVCYTLQSWPLELTSATVRGKPLSASCSFFRLFGFSEWLSPKALCILSFRNVPTKYSEHKFVTLAMISSLQMFLVGSEYTEIWVCKIPIVLEISSLLVDSSDSNLHWN